MLFSIFDVLRTFEALKMGKNEEKFESSIFFEAQKYYFVFELRLFFQIVLFATLWKLTLKMTTLFRRCLTLFNSRWKTQRCFNVVQCCKFQLWRTQCCFNVDLKLCCVATSYQPKNNVDPTLKCLLGTFSNANRALRDFENTFSPHT